MSTSSWAGSDAVKVTRPGQVQHDGYRRRVVVVGVLGRAVDDAGGWRRRCRWGLHEEAFNALDHTDLLTTTRHSSNASRRTRAPTRRCRWRSASGRCAAARGSAEDAAIERGGRPGALRTCQDRQIRHDMLQHAVAALHLRGAGCRGACGSPVVGVDGDPVAVGSAVRANATAGGTMTSIVVVGAACDQRGAAAGAEGP